MKLPTDNPADLNPPKDKVAPELDHPELEYRPWGDPDTWIPPERPVQ